VDAGDTAFLIYGSKGYQAPEFMHYTDLDLQKSAIKNEPKPGILMLGSPTCTPSGDMPAVGQLLVQGFRKAIGLPKISCYKERHTNNTIIYTIRKEIFEDMPHEMKEVVQGCLEVNPKKRLSIEALLQKDFFALPVETLQQRWSASASFTPLGQLLK
jgi:serine/threonine protein kinase